MNHIVSVIIPCFNNAPYIRKCVTSVLSQTYSAIEVIVIDDGSDDDPSPELADISDARLRPIVKLPHRGVSSARNVGIEQASGSYIIFIDGDDWIESDHIQCLVDGIGDSDCAMIQMCIDYPDRTEVNAESSAIFRQHPKVSRSDFNLLFDSYLLSSPCNKIYRTSLLKVRDYLRFDAMVSYAEDLLFNLEYFAKIHSVSLINRATYHYVKHGLVSGTSRYHRYTAYTLSRISQAACTTLHHFSDTSMQILLHHYIWGMLNLYHKDSTLTEPQRRAEIDLIVNIPEYRKSLSQLSAIGVSRKLAWILRTCNPTVISKALLYRNNKSLIIM